MAQSILGFNNLDEFFAFHAAPALAGIKPASLFSCPANLMPQADKVLAAYNRQFKARSLKRAAQILNCFAAAAAIF